MIGLQTMKTIKYSQKPSGALNIRDLAIGNQSKSGIGAVGLGAVTIKDVSAVKEAKVEPTAVDPRFDVSKTKKDIIKYRVRVVDPLDGRARAWGPYFAIKPLLSEIDDPEAISRVEARAAERGSAVFVAGLISIVTGQGLGQFVAVPSGGDDGPMLDQIQLVDAQIRMLYQLPARVAGGPFFHQDLRHPADQYPSLLKITTPFFTGQRFWLTGSMRSSVQPTDATGLGMLPSGEFLVAKACIPNAPAPATAFSWKKEQIQVLLRAGGQVVPGPVIPHYCDLSVAQWWWRIGFALASDNSIIEALDTADTKTGRFPFQVYSELSSEELSARRSRAISELAVVVAAGTHPAGSHNWTGALDYHLGNKGISDRERTILLTNQNALASLSAASPYSTSNDGWDAQASYVRALFECIARGYDAMNVPWYIDPLARELFRDWFAGHAGNEFDPASDYNSGYWFSTREQCGEKRFAVLRPRISPGADDLSLAGEMPARLSSMWKNLVSAQDLRTLEFVQKAGVMLWSGSETSDPYMASSAQNRGFASNLTMYGPTNELSGIWWDARAFARGSGVTPKGSLLEGEVGFLDSGGSPWNLWGHRPISRTFSGDWYAKILHAPPLQPRDRISDWRAGGFDHPGVAGVHVQGAVPLRWYVAYAREWLSMLCQDDPVSPSPAPDMPSVRPDRRWPGFGSMSLPRRSVGEVLQQSLSSALQTNLTWGSIYGSQQRLAQVLADKSAEFGRSQPNRTIGAITGVTSAIGTAVGTALVPAVGSLVGIGVDTIGRIMAAAIPEYVCDRYGRDDLGRAKPVFERTYLSGDPEKDVVPSFSVTLPFGFCRTLVELPPVREVPPAPSLAPPPPADDSSGNAAKILVPMGLAVGALAAVYFISRSRRQE